MSKDVVHDYLDLIVDAVAAENYGVIVELVSKVREEIEQ